MSSEWLHKLSFPSNFGKKRPIPADRLDEGDDEQTKLTDFTDG